MSKALYKYRNVVISLLIFEFVVVIASSAVVKTSFLLGLSLYILIKNTVMVAIIYYLCRVFDQEQVTLISQGKINLVDAELNELLLSYKNSLDKTINITMCENITEYDY